MTPNPFPSRHHLQLLRSFRGLLKLLPAPQQNLLRLLRPSLPHLRIKLRFCERFARTYEPKVGVSSLHIIGKDEVTAARTEAAAGYLSMRNYNGNAVAGPQ